MDRVLSVTVGFMISLQSSGKRYVFVIIVPIDTFKIYDILQLLLPDFMMKRVFHSLSAIQLIITCCFSSVLNCRCFSLITCYFSSNCRFCWICPFSLITCSFSLINCSFSLASCWFSLDSLCSTSPDLALSLSC